MQVEVTQADRDAAASGYFAWFTGSPVVHDRIKTGNADNHSIVQAFARHRLAERERSARRIAELEARLEIDPAHSMDGIYARDETIRCLDAQADGLEKRMAEAYQLAGSIALEHDISGPDVERLLDLLSGQ